MPRPADQPESNSALPQPELNPLVNPLLGQNMGRWAEVYFTSPPEKREEAVLNLLHELEENASGPVSNPGIQPREIAHGDATQERLPQNLAPALRIKREFVDCRSCGTKNPADQKFCGHCGFVLASEPPVEPESATRNRPTQAPSRNEAVSFSSAESAPHPTRYEFAHYENTQTSVETGTEFDNAIAHGDAYEFAWRRDVDPPNLMPVYEPVPYRYRIYVGAALALLIAVLVYIAWHGTQASSGNSHALPQTPPSEATQSPQRSQASPSPVAASSAKAGSQNESHNDNKTNVAAPPESNATGHQATHATTRMDNATETKQASNSVSARTSVPAERPASLQDTSPQDNGRRELAVAEGFLRGKQGKIRDSSEAAKWLWQAVRKENAAATLMLSDLYLKGDGVPKSCDQGRMLLNAAARRGAPGAGERIRNLQAFGCQ